MAVSISSEENMECSSTADSKKDYLEASSFDQAYRISLAAQHTLRIFWLLVKDDFDTFVLPNTVFGLVAALVEARCSHTGHLQIFSRIPHTVLFNLGNLLIFDLANQRLPDSIAEDKINKPWRPLPRGLITPKVVSRILLGIIPVVLLGSWYAEVGGETALLVILTWIYNDLRGGDEHWVVRNGIIAVAFFFYNVGSAKVASGSQVENVNFIWRWAAVVSALIFTTMHVQDFKDTEGDRVRGRHTAPIALGNDLARWTFAMPMLFWSVACTVAFRVASWYGTVILGLGGTIAWRSLHLRKREDDRQTWKLWCLWCALLYGVPLLGDHSLTCGINP